MSAALRQPTTAHRHSCWAIAKGLAAATFAAPIAAYLAAFPLSLALENFPADAGLIVYLTLGVLAMPVATLLIVAIVVAAVGTPIWTIASARGWTDRRHAALGGAAAGALLGAVETGFALQGSASWPAVAAEFVAIVLVGTMTGLVARLVAGPPRLSPTTL